jgi:transposase InsO family protein
MQANTKHFAKDTGPRATRKNEIWSVEFAILDVPGRPTLLAAIDVFSRAPVVLSSTSGETGDVARILDSACRRLGYPEKFWLDQGREWRAQELREWADRRGVELIFGAPILKRSIAERFRDELHQFLSNRTHGARD